MAFAGALTPITQTGRLLTVTTPLPFDVLLIDSFVGSDKISSPFGCQVELSADRAFGKDQLVTADMLIGNSMTIGMQLADGTKRFFNGIVRRFNRSGHDARFTHYRAELVPWFSLLTLTSDCRIFQNKKVPEIISDIFEELGFKGLFRFSPSREYTAWDYCVQYRESDFNFVNRIMEQEGIFYFFEHDEDKHILVMGDDPKAHTPCPGQKTARFAPDVGIGENEDSIVSLETTQELVGSKWILRDYHFEMPKNTLQLDEPNVVQVPVTKDLQIYDYPGEYAQKFNEPGKRLDKVRQEGETIVKLRMQEDELNQKVLNGTSHCRAFTSGFKFEVVSSGLDDIKGSFVLTSVQHSAVQSPSYLSEQGTQVFYENSFTCIPDKVPFRPARKTPKPVITGPQTARVVDETKDPNAEPKEEIWPDKYGRVRVRFPWDREGKFSAWIRVAQQWAGRGWGQIWIPRVGDEVIVDFLEGDPDCPIIMGSVYNADNATPYTLAANKTQSGIKTRSSPKGTAENYNEIRFEDKKDHEDLLIHAEKTMHNSVEASQFITVGADRHIKTGYTDKDGNEHGDVKELVHNNHNLHVKMDQRTGIDGKSSTYVQKDCFHWVRGSQRTTVALEEFTEAPTIIFEAGQTLSIKGPGGSIVIDATGVTIVGNIVNINSGGAPAVSSIGGGYIGDKADPPDDPS
jgi:type VI secretion system secreted protein VgrG